MVMSRDCVLNDNKARRELGYAPTMGVQEGLQNLAPRPQ
jgi:nucleoside-diphosphate-sugar epimerase